ncbi:MAG: PilZ domain-containing protein [Spirochaetaceae bacterium]|jgi:c-di-GMP-binding flagellar brake protein YcgR|nr:PilZ domain-containing protein [Spirochaetaceae bacterium]
MKQNSGSGLVAVIITIIIASMTGLIFFVIKKNKGRNKISWMKFYAKGKESGFSGADIKILKKLAQNSSIEHPTVLFWSQTQMDECIKRFVQDLKRTDKEFLPENQKILEKLYNFRKKMELDRPIYRNGITDSRTIDKLQIVQVVAADIGTFKSKVINNKAAYISIERPDRLKFSKASVWKGKHVLIYFWRKGDAGYCFETDIIDEIQANKPPLLTLRHSNNLRRTQSRKSLRVKTHGRAMLYHIDDKNDALKPEVRPGIKCYLEDISDSGCALKTGETVSIGLRVIVQFVIDKTQLSIIGVVRNVEYDEVKNTSILHIETDLIPIDVKNKIFSVMFGMVNDEIYAGSIKNSGETGITDNSAVETGAANTKYRPDFIKNKIGEERKNADQEYDDSHDFDFFDWGDQSKTEDEGK